MGPKFNVGEVVRRHGSSQLWLVEAVEWDKESQCWIYRLSGDRVWWNELLLSKE